MRLIKGSKTQEAKTSGGKAETMNKENFVMICQMIEDNNSLSIDHIAHEVEIDEKMLGSFSQRSKSSTLTSSMMSWISVIG